MCKSAGAHRGRVRDDHLQSGPAEGTAESEIYRWHCSASQASETVQGAILTYAAERLGWRRTIFVGDSISQLVFRELEDQMFSALGQPASSRTLFHPSSTSTKSQCSEWMVGNITLAVCYFSAGRYEGATRVAPPLSVSSCGAVDSYDGVNLGDAIECMFQLGKLHITDYIVLNMGVHHKLSRANVTIPPNVLAVPWWRRGHGQCRVWRQTLPQHFPNTRTGAFEVFMPCDPAAATQCAPIPKAALDFDQGYNLPAEAALLTVAKNILGYGWRSGKIEYHIRRMNDRLDNYQVINPDSRSRKDKTVAYIFK